MHETGREISIVPVDCPVVRMGAGHMEITRGRIWNAVPPLQKRHPDNHIEDCDPKNPRNKQNKSWRAPDFRLDCFTYKMLLQG